MNTESILAMTLRYIFDESNTCTSRREWATRAGISPSAISQMCHGLIAPSGLVLWKIFHAVRTSQTVEPDARRRIDELARKPASSVCPKWENVSGSVEEFIRVDREKEALDRLSGMPMKVRDLVLEMMEELSVALLTRYTMRLDHIASELSDYIHASAPEAVKNGAAADQLRKMLVDRLDVNLKNCQPWKSLPVDVRHRQADGMIRNHMRLARVVRKPGALLIEAELFKGLNSTFVLCKDVAVRALLSLSELVMIGTPVFPEARLFLDAVRQRLSDPRARALSSSDLNFATPEPRSMSQAEAQPNKSGRRKF